jgi:hypothetical protein
VVPVSPHAKCQRAARVQAANQEAPSEVLTSHKYCEDVYRSKRRPTRTVKVRLTMQILIQRLQTALHHSQLDLRLPRVGVTPWRHASCNATVTPGITGHLPHGTTALAGW